MFYHFRTGIQNLYTYNITMKTNLDMPNESVCILYQINYDKIIIIIIRRGQLKYINYENGIRGTNE